MRRPMSVPVVALLMVSTLAGCRDAAPDPEPSGEGTEAAPAPERVVERVYERSFAFVAELGDSLLLVPWIMTHQARPDSVLRSVAGWLSRGQTWEPFYREHWSTHATRSPERILPHGTLSIVVRDGDLVDGLVYQDGPRSLEVVMGEVIAAWVGPGGETFDLLEGAVYLSEERIDGTVIDLSRSWTPSEQPAGDWAFLVSGDSVRLVMAGNVEHGADTEPVYRVWAQRGAEDLVWPEVEVDWSERQAFPPARRDVPTTWSIDSPDGTLSGTLRSVTAELEAGEGTGPLLPVLALVEVEGVLEARGSTIPVRGILVHQRR
jgi:hypothetical protein